MVCSPALQAWWRDDRVVERHVISVAGRVYRHFQHGRRVKQHLCLCWLTRHEAMSRLASPD